ncbi:hypothetical protein [Larkinella punicea]|uniref:hypothetical protein n=1 Tax=Larkinella punicea TaxID=2315727 RepID=UPI001058C53E|nr:hypothetical protein [Larkinella punicea]
MPDLLRMIHFGFPGGIRSYKMDHPYGIGVGFPGNVRFYKMDHPDGIDVGLPVVSDSTKWIIPTGLLLAFP